MRSTLHCGAQESDYSVARAEEGHRRTGAEIDRQHAVPSLDCQLLKDRRAQGRRHHGVSFRLALGSSHLSRGMGLRLENLLLSVHADLVERKCRLLSLLLRYLLCLNGGCIFRRKLEVCDIHCVDDDPVRLKRNSQKRVYF